MDMQLKTREAALVIGLGIGDLVFIEPGIRLLFMNGFMKVYLFCRNDGMKLYHAYEGVEAHPEKAFKQFQPAGPIITVDKDTHGNSGNRTRVFTESIIRQAGLSIDIPENLTPQLPVDQLHIDWAETFIKPRAGQEVILYQMESSRYAKNMPKELSLELIGKMLENGRKVLILSENHQDFPKHPGLKLLKGIPIERFMGICKHVDRVVALDSAPAWIASAVGADTLAIFGPTDPGLYCPPNDNISILRWNAGCLAQPCGNIAPECPRRSCMDIPVPVLYDAVTSPHTPDDKVVEFRDRRISTGTIALLRLDGMGGTLTLSDQAQKVKAKYPDKRVLLIIRSREELFEDNPYIEEIVCVGMSDWAEVLEHFKEKFFALADIRFAVAKWYGNFHQTLSEPYEQLYDSFPMGQGILGTQGRHHILITDECLGLPSDTIDSRIYFDIPERQFDGDYLVFSSGVDPVHKGLIQTKCWPYWRELVNMLGIPCVQVGTQFDMPVPGAIDMRGMTDLFSLSSLLCHAHVIIVTEGGIMHLAYALGCKNVIVIRGPTASPLLQYPGQVHIDSILCEPCLFSSADWYRNCPLELLEPVCMVSISPERVVMAYQDMVQGKQRLPV